MLWNCTTFNALLSISAHIPSYLLQLCFPYAVSLYILFLIENKPNADRWEK